MRTPSPGDHGTSDVAKIYRSSRSKKRIAFMFVKVAERRRECRPPQIGWTGSGLQGLRLIPLGRLDNPLAGSRNCECERARLDGENWTDG